MNFASGEGKKRAKIWSTGLAVQGEGRSGGTEYDQTKTLKPTSTRETPLHGTVKQAPTPHNTHTNTTHHTPHTHTTHHATPQHTPHHTTTQHQHQHPTPQQVKLDLAKLGLAQTRFGQDQPGPSSPDRPKFRSFFFLSRPHYVLFLSLSGCLLVEFWWCFFEAPGP